MSPSNTRLYTQVIGQLKKRAISSVEYQICDGISPEQPYGGTPTPFAEALCVAVVRGETNTAVNLWLEYQLYILWFNANINKHIVLI